MNTRNGKMKVRALVLAVEAVLLAMYAMPALAADEQAASLKVPANSAEFGVLYVPKDSAKFGEYTGLNKEGGYLNGNFNIRGGDAYGDGNGTKRWELTGSDLGLTSRSAGASFSDQGRWSIGINYDQLTHYTSSTFQTPYQGTVGGNIFTLPGFGAAADTRVLSAIQLGQFHNLDISNNRDNTSLTGTLVLDRQWNLKLDFNHLDRSGAKLGSVASAGWGGATGEVVSILPIPQNDRTDTATLALNYAGDKGHATIGYFGSFYRDNVNGLKFDTFSTATPVMQTYGTPPGNDLHQFNMTGGYAFSGRTKVAGGLSYSRNSQNTAYAYDSGLASGANGGGVGPMIVASPTASLNGTVVTTHADLKLTDQTTKNLALSAGLKYDDRDNQTASNAYSARAIDGRTTNGYNYPNTPLSVKKWQGELAGDYRIDARNKIRLAYNHEEIKRECNQFAVIAQGTVGTNTSINAYPPGTDCVVATKTKEDKINATYRLKASDGVNLNAGYTYSDRRSDFDTNARTAMISVDDNNPALTTAQKIRGLNGGDYPGFHPFFLSNRTEHAVKAGANWQATDRLSAGLNGRYTDDNYDGLGVQKGHSWMLNLDTTYSYAEDGTFTFYVTGQERTRDVTDQTGTLGTWTNKLKDTDTTVGLALKQGGLMSGKLELFSDLTYSLGKSDYTTALNYTPAVACTLATQLTCGDLPSIKSEMYQFKLTGNYKLEKNAKLALGYLYRRLKADDFYYNGLINGYTPSGLLPTNQQAPSYAVNVVFASFIYTFK